MTRVLEAIVRKSVHALLRRKAALPVAELERRVAQAPPTRDLTAALALAGISLVAELKARSPSAGILCRPYEPAKLAQIYEANGARALSVLTQASHFGGRLEHLSRVRQSSRLPLLQKDFLLDEYQLLEARVAGADAVLLIVRLLGGRRLRQMHQVATDLGMSVIVEVHSRADLGEALPLKPAVIGINHRDLDTLQLNMSLVAELRSDLPEGCLVVAESGLSSAAAVAQLKASIDAILVGEAILAASDRPAKVREFAQA